MLCRKSRILRTIPREASRKSPASPSTTSRTTRSTLSSRFSLCARERSLVNRCARREKTRRLVRAHSRVILPSVSPSEAEPSEANHPPTTFAHLPPPRVSPPSSPRVTRPHLRPTQSSRIHRPRPRRPPPALASPSSPSLAPRRSSPHPSSRRRARPRPTDRRDDRRARPPSTRSLTTTVSEKRPRLPSPVERGRRMNG